MIPGSIQKIQTVGLSPDAVHLSVEVLDGWGVLVVEFIIEEA